jgi:hypothetical protein
MDLHIHSKYSGHSLLKPQDIARIARRKGLDGVAITDHDEIEGAVELKTDFPTIVGEEISSDEGDIIGLFLNEKVSEGPALDVIDKIRSQGGLVVMPHPFDSMRREALRSEEICRKGDLIEVFNSRVIRKEDNLKARDFARRVGLPGIVGSDAHSSMEIGRCWMDIASADDASSFMRSVRSAEVHTERSPLVVHLQTKILNVRKVFS